MGVKVRVLIRFLAWRLSGGVGVFHSKGWGSKFVSYFEICLPWASREGAWDVLGILPGCPGPGGVQQKKFVFMFRSLVVRAILSV